MRRAAGAGATCGRVCRGLGLTPDPAPTLAALGRELDEAYVAVADDLENNPSLKVAPVQGKRGDRAVLEEDEALASVNKPRF